MRVGYGPNVVMFFLLLLLSLSVLIGYAIVPSLRVRLDAEEAVATGAAVFSVFLLLLLKSCVSAIGGWK